MLEMTGTLIKDAISEAEYAIIAAMAAGVPASKIRVSDDLQTVFSGNSVTVSFGIEFLN